MRELGDLCHWSWSTNYASRTAPWRARERRPAKTCPLLPLPVCHRLASQRKRVLRTPKHCNTQTYWTLFDVHVLTLSVILHVCSGVDLQVAYCTRWPWPSRSATPTTIQSSAGSTIYCVLTPRIFLASFPAVLCRRHVTSTTWIVTRCSAITRRPRRFFTASCHCTWRHITK